jgi:hypothetical protein
MKIKIVNPKEWETSTGKKKVLFQDESGNSMDSWDLGLLEKADQVVEGTLKSREYKGKEYTTFTPTEESKTKPASAPTKAAFDPAYLEKKNELNARQTALNCAVTLSSAKIELGDKKINGKETLKMAEVYLKWLKGVAIKKKAKEESEEPPEEEPEIENEEEVDVNDVPF